MERASPGLERAGGCRWAGAGRSTLSDPASAGAEAVRAAVAGRRDTALVLLFACGLLDVDAITEGAADAAADAPIAGCTTAGALGPAAGDDGVLALALGGEGLAVSTVATPAVEPREAGVRAAACLGDIAGAEHRLLLLFADGPSADHADLVRGAYSVAGAGVPLAGGIAAHPLGPDRGAVLHDGVALRGAAVGVALGADVPFGVGVAHGWDPIGEPLLVTRAVPGRVLELNDRPALEVYRERTGLGPGATRAEGLAHPLGRHGRTGPSHVRAVELDDGADGGLSCAVEAGSIVSVMRARPASGPGVADAATRDALATLAGAAPQALLAFDCAGRAAVRTQRGEDASIELARLTEHAGRAALAAISTHGELGRVRGITGFHEQSLVVVAVP